MATLERKECPMTQVSFHLYELERFHLAMKNEDVSSSKQFTPAEVQEKIAAIELLLPACLASLPDPWSAETRFDTHWTFGAIVSKLNRWNTMAELQKLIGKIQDIRKRVTEDCPICLLAIEKDNFHYLSCCGHVMCKPCYIKVTDANCVICRGDSKTHTWLDLKPLLKKANIM